MTKTICIDAGHYGKYNRSPANKAYYESDMAWKLHLLQKKYLEQYGFKVITTRKNQATDLELTARGRCAKGCDLFISDHSNAVGSGVNESTKHVAVYHLTDDTTTSVDNRSKEIAQKIAPVIAEVMGINDSRVLTRKSSKDRNGDGIMNDNYYGVLHGARMVNVPALILEHGFHTNTATTNWLLNDDNLDKLAKAEAKVIAEYFGLITVSKTGFNDVSDNAYYADPVEWAVKNGITSGIDNNNFGPDQTCTRGQAVTFLRRAYGAPEPASAKNPFKDVNESDYYYKAVQWAVQKGITNGVDDTHFNPKYPCTRGQIVTFMYRAAGSPDVLSVAKNKFVDVIETDYYYKAVQWAAQKGITNGVDDTHFAPNEKCTRAQIVTFLYRNMN